MRRIGDRVKRSLFFFFVLVLASGLSEVEAQRDNAISKTFEVEGQSITVRLTVFEPPAAVKSDVSMLNQSSPIHCSHLLYSLLSKGDLESASKLSNDPEKTKAKWTRQRDRLGEEEFKRMAAGYFSGGVQIRYLFANGGSHMLIVHDDDMDVDMAQFYAESGKIFVIDERDSREKGLLGKIFANLKREDGKVEVK